MQCLLTTGFFVPPDNSAPTRLDHWLRIGGMILSLHFPGAVDEALQETGRIW